jgi:O-antigen/teichoic acid export membrane protein
MSRPADSTFYKKVARNFAFKPALAVAGIAKGILLARILGPEGRGTFAVAASVSSIGAQLGSFGLDNAAQYFAAGSPASAAEIFRSQQRQTAAAGAAGCLLLLLLNIFFPSLLPLEHPLLLLTAMALPLSLFYLLGRSLILGLHEVTVFNSSELLGQTLSIVLLLLFGTSALNTPQAFILAQILPSVVGIVCVVGKLRMILGKTADIERNSVNFFGRMVRYGARAYVLGGMLCVLDDMNLFFVNHFSGAAATGYYALAQRASGSLGMLSLPFSQLLLPHLSQDSETEYEKWRLIRRLLLIVSVLLCVGCAVIGSFIRPIIHLLYGEEYLPASAACVLLLTAQIFRTAGNILLAYLASRRYPGALFVILPLLLLGQAVAARILIPQFNVEGAALCSLSAQAVLALCLYVLCRRCLRCTRRSAHTAAAA